MKQETISGENINQTSALGFHLPETLDWQTVWISSGNQGTTTHKLRTELVAVDSTGSTPMVYVPGGTQSFQLTGGMTVGQVADLLDKHFDSHNTMVPPADWSYAEQRLREIYQNPARGITAAAIIADGRGVL